MLKLVKDRQRWLHWLFQAKKRYGLSILNYIVTSNHIHLLVADDGPVDAIPRSMQLLAGRTGQEYNQRKKRKGAFWQDRYHATAVQSNAHLIKCMIYIDLNMVRAGVVKHPQEWIHSGYHELQIGIRSKGRKILEDEDDYQLRDRQTDYGDRAQFNSSNSFYWDLDHKPIGPHIP